jgi:hypothetical protein
VDPRQIMGLSVAATERCWQARDLYTSIEHDQDRRLDSLGEVKSEDVYDTRMTLVNGARFRQLTFPGHTRRIKKGLDIKCDLAIGFQTIGRFSCDRFPYGSTRRQIS